MCFIRQLGLFIFFVYIFVFTLSSVVFVLFILRVFSIEILNFPQISFSNGIGRGLFEG